MLKRVLQKLGLSAAPALASIYLRDGRVFVQASDRTFWRTAGFWVSSGPVDCLAASDSPALIGTAVLAALERSRVEVPVPAAADMKTLSEPMFEAMGVRSHSASMQGTRYCNIRLDQGTLTVEPYNNGGSSGEGRGYRPLGETQSLRLPANSTPEAVGQAVLTALERAT